MEVGYGIPMTHKRCIEKSSIKLKHVFCSFHGSKGQSEFTMVVEIKPKILFSGAATLKK